MKQANKKKLTVVKADNRKDAKKESPLVWFVRVTENGAQLKSALESIRQNVKAIDLTLNALRRDGLIGEDAVDSIERDGGTYVAKLEKYVSVLARRRRETMVSRANPDKKESGASEGNGN